MVFMALFTETTSPVTCFTAANARPVKERATRIATRATPTLFTIKAHLLSQVNVVVKGKLYAKVGKLIPHRGQLPKSS
jgi:hypothetical protein